MLLIKRPYKKKPNRFLRPNIAHPNLRDVDYFFPFLEQGGNARDVINNVIAVRQGQATWKRNGIYSNGNPPNAFDPGQLIQASDDFTIAIEFISNLDAQDRTILSQDGGYRTWGIILFTDTTSGRIWFSVVTTSPGTVAHEVFPDTGRSLVGRRLTLIARAKQSDKIEAWVFENNSEIAYDSASLGGGTMWRDDGPPTTRLFRFEIDNSRYFDGHIFGAYIARKALPDSQVRAIGTDFWAPFERRIWVPRGEAPPPVITGTGALQAQDAAVSGAGEVIGVTTGTGALQAQDAAVTGVGEVRTPAVGTGTLQAQSGQVSGAGAIVHDGAGALQAQSAAVVGVGEVGNVRTGTGALQAQPAAVSGQGDRTSVGTGTLQAQAAAVSGAGVVEGLISGTGALQAQSAAVAGAGIVARVGTGALQAQSAQVAGIGAILGDLSLTPADIAAIADAVYAKLVSEGLVSQINEIWQRRGLDSANPQTYDKAGNQIRVGDITIDLSGDPSSVTQTRQP